LLETEQEGDGEGEAKLRLSSEAPVILLVNLSHKSDIAEVTGEEKVLHMVQETAGMVVLASSDTDTLTGSYAAMEAIPVMLESADIQQLTLSNFQLASQQDRHPGQEFCFTGGHSLPVPVQPSLQCRRQSDVHPLDLSLGQPHRAGSDSEDLVLTPRNDDNISIIRSL
jgi:hypothetical protein